MFRRIIIYIAIVICSLRVNGSLSSEILESVKEIRQSLNEVALATAQYEEFCMIADEIESLKPRKLEFARILQQKQKDQLETLKNLRRLFKKWRLDETSEGRALIKETEELILIYSEESERWYDRFARQLNMKKRRLKRK